MRPRGRFLRHRRRTGGTHATIQLPTLCSPPGTGPHAGEPRQIALAGAGGLRHTALGWGVRTPRTRRRTAAPAGRLPPGVYVSGLASSQRSTDPVGARDQNGPGTSDTTNHGPTSGIFKPAVARARG
ncbi:hypothetical protein EYZ11_013570 [Aspergillus tanneri]|uniref:Uncharacterized protein n=1 Tax=Aspergillus tanneri TaxID=1220188 RepID=A0A4V3UME4_9EURO|nr:hypothetical protein EYZ11_013570 [Aspergillus tanneri]